MVQLTKEQRIFVVLTYWETKSYVATNRLFRQRFPDREPPAKHTIYKNVKKYLEKGMSLNTNKNNSGRRRMALTPENVARVRELLLAEREGISCRRNALGLTKSTFNRIVQLDLQFHPYKMKVRHELKQADYARQITYCQWFLEKTRNNRAFLPSLIIGDEAGFSMNGLVNTHNVRCYAPRGQNPELFYDRNECRMTLMVWAGLCGNGSMIGPFFFDGSVSGESYLAMLNENVLPELMRIYNHRFHNDHFRYIMVGPRWSASS